MHLQLREISSSCNLLHLIRTADNIPADCVVGLKFLVIFFSILFYVLLFFEDFTTQILQN